MTPNAKKGLIWGGVALGGLLLLSSQSGIVDEAFGSAGSGYIGGSDDANFTDVSKKESSSSPTIVNVEAMSIPMTETLSTKKSTASVFNDVVATQSNAYGGSLTNPLSLPMAFNLPRKPLSFTPDYSDNPTAPTLANAEKLESKKSSKKNKFGVVYGTRTLSVSK